MHEDPPVFNYRVRGQGPEVRPGLVVAIEPMVVLGDRGRRTSRTTAGRSSTDDGSAAAHWEHSVAVHEDGIWVLTAADGGAAGLAPLRHRAGPDRLISVRVVANGAIIHADWRNAR